MWGVVGRCSPCSAWLMEIWRRIRLEFTVEVRLLVKSCLQPEAGSGRTSPRIGVLEMRSCCVLSIEGALAANLRGQGSAALRPDPLALCPQLPLLKARWKQVLFGALFQYVHGIFTQLAHRMHEPQEQPLGDLGFKYLPVGAHGAGSGAQGTPAC